MLRALPSGRATITRHVFGIEVITRLDAGEFQQLRAEFIALERERRGTVALPVQPASCTTAKEICP